MGTLDLFRMLARYNRTANETLYAKCAELDDDEYRRKRSGSFGSIHALLNHILLGDRIWMSRFMGGGATTPPLDTVLFDKFEDLRWARADQDTIIETFFEQAREGFLERPLRYTNSRGKDCVDMPPLAVLHFFNHQTHHRGQVHVMLSQTPIRPPIARSASAVESIISGSRIITGSQRTGKLTEFAMKHLSCAA